MKVRKSQAVIEFAIVTPLLLLSLMSVIDFGFMWSAKHTLIRLGRDAGSYYSARTSVSWSEMSSYVSQKKPQNTAWENGITWKDKKNFTDPVTGVQMIEFNLSYEWPIYTPIIQTLFGKDTITLSTATAKMSTMQFAKG